MRQETIECNRTHFNITFCPHRTWCGASIPLEQAVCHVTMVIDATMTMSMISDQHDASKFRSEIMDLKIMLITFPDILFSAKTF